MTITFSPPTNMTIDSLWEECNFRPSEPQIEAIYHASGSAFLTADTGSGKSLVIQWLVANLIAAKKGISGGIPLDSIFAPFNSGNHWFLGCLGIEVVGWCGCC